MYIVVKTVVSSYSDQIDSAAWRFGSMREAEQKMQQLVSESSHMQSQNLQTLHYDIENGEFVARYDDYVVSGAILVENNDLNAKSDFRKMNSSQSFKH